VAAYSQSSGGNSGTVRGTVIDPSGAVIAGAAVQIQNPVSHFDQSAITDNQGNFAFVNIPYNNYHLSATASGFQTATQDADVRSPIPLTVKISLKIGAATSTVTVEEAGDLLETDSTAHTDVDRALFDKLPLESQSSSLSSLVTLATPGVSADSNGLFHGLGDHASNSFSLDGQPISDQQSKVFSNQIPTDAVQSMEVIEGAPPAEFGDKTSLVIEVTTRSGLGVTQPHGDFTASYGAFGSANGAFDLSYGRSSWGNFIAVSGLDTGRFLDGPEFQVYHDHGNEENIFDRVDLKPSEADSINVNLSFTRSWFQTPNSFDAQTADAWSGLVVNNGGLGPNGLPAGPTDQRSKIRTFNIAPTWTRLHRSYVRRLRAAGSIQLLSERQSFRRPPARSSASDHRPESQADGCWASHQCVVYQGHSQHQGGNYLPGHDYHGKGQFWGGGSYFERGMFERLREPGHERQPDGPWPVWRVAAGESQLQSVAGLLRLDPNIAAPGVRRLSRFHQRPIHV